MAFLSLLFSIASGMLLLSLLVFIHELGHFLAAKACKIPVEAFSIGFGKPIWSKKIGETEYRISPIPFGGYVKMSGESPDDEKDGFRNKPIWQRAVVALAGPAFNIVSAILFLMVINVVGVKKYEHRDVPLVGFVDKKAVTSELFQPMDSIVSINGKVIKSWPEIDRAFNRFDKSYNVEFVRNGKTLSTEFSIPLPEKKKLHEYRGAGIYPHQIEPIVISFIEEGRPAQRAGLQKSDTLVTINGEQVNSFSQVSMAVSYFKDNKKPISLTVKRDSLISLSMIPEEIDVLDKKGNKTGKKVFRIGVGQAPLKSYVEKYSLLGSIKPSLIDAKNIFDDVTNLLNPSKLKFLINYASGPLAIMQIAGATTKRGLIQTLFFLALISINLGVINLLPLAITDGGILFFLLIEGIRGRPVSIEKQEMIAKVFLILFLSFFLFVTFNDILGFNQLNKLLQ